MVHVIFALVREAGDYGFSGREETNGGTFALAGIVKASEAKTHTFSPIKLTIRGSFNLLFWEVAGFRIAADDAAFLAKRLRR